MKTTLKQLLLTFITVIASTSLSAQSLNILWNANNLTQMRGSSSNRVAKEFVSLADKAIEGGAVSVCSKPRAFSGNKHNYESLQRYSWRDDTKNDGSYVIRDGVVNPEINDYDFPRMLTLRKNLQYSALAFYITGDKRYYSFFVKQIDVWFRNKSTRMAPNFDYSQMIPGRNNGKGMSYGIIEAYEFNDVLESIRLVESQKSLGKRRTKALESWFADFALWMQKSDNGKEIDRWENNICIAYDVLLFNCLTFCNKNQEAKLIADSFISKRIEPQIKEDGSQPAELKRTQAYSYSIYNLQHILDFAIMLKNQQGTNLLAKSPRISGALRYLTQYMGNRQSFKYQEIGDWTQQEKLLVIELSRAEKLLPPTPWISTHTRNFNAEGSVYSVLK